MAAQTSAQNSTHQTQTIASKKEVTKLKKEIAQLNKETTKLKEKTTILHAKENRYEKQNKILLMSHEQDLKYIAYMRKNIKVFVSDNLLLYKKMLEQMKFLRMQILYITPSHLSKIMQQFSSNLALNLSLSNQAVESSTMASPAISFKREISSYITKISQKVKISPVFVVSILLLTLLFVILCIIGIRRRCKTMVSSQNEKARPGAIRIERKPDEVVLQEVSSKEPAFEMSKEIEEEAPVPKEADKKQDYQFLSGEDVEASKLDLGRALLEMGSLAHAKQVLDGVLEEGNEKQKAEAKKLLKKFAEKNK